MSECGEREEAVNATVWAMRCEPGMAQRSSEVERTPCILATRSALFAHEQAILHSFEPGSRISAIRAVQQLERLKAVRFKRFAVIMIHAFFRKSFDAAVGVDVKVGLHLMS